MKSKKFKEINREAVDIKFKTITVVWITFKLAHY